MGKGEKSASGCFGYPLSIFFIFTIEFCERFSTLGMQAILVLYLKYFLHWDNDLATMVYHTFIAMCHLISIFGAIIADSWLGRFKTIIYLSVVYVVGQIILSVSAIHDLTDVDRDGTPDNITLHIALSMIGLILMALGTAGILPCVTALGGDQFDESQEKQRSRFFSIFYLCINAGNLLSIIITPILRIQECGIHTQQKCYPLAFGMPASVMVVALVIFIAGSGLYKKVSPQGNIVVKVFKCISFAISNRYRNRSKSIPKREHWMDWAKEKYDGLLIAQIKMVLKVLFLYIPLPMFCALFEQQGSRWTLQATTMDGNFGPVQIQPDQMQTVNAILLFVFVPAFDMVIYPLIKKCKLNFTPLKRINVGMFLAAMAFVAAAVVQIEIDKTLPTFPDSGHIQVRAINLGADNLTVSFEDAPLPSVVSFQASEYKILPINSTINFTYGNASQDFSQDGLSGETRYTWIVRNENSVQAEMDKDISEKPEQGYNAIKFINSLQEAITVKIDEHNVGDLLPFSFSNYTMLTLGVKKIEGFTRSGKNCSVESISFGFGSSYKIIVKECSSSMSIDYIEDIQANTVHMALQIPQYFILTGADVLFFITGLEFAYSQAPSNMKSVVQAGWLLTIAVGNIIVLIVAGTTSLIEQWAEYLLFAALLVAVCIIFAIMSYFYTYVDPAKIEAQFESDGKKKREEEIEELSLGLLDGHNS